MRLQIILNLTRPLLEKERGLLKNFSTKLGGCKDRTTLSFRLPDKWSGAEKSHEISPTTALGRDDNRSRINF